MDFYTVNVLKTQNLLINFFLFLRCFIYFLNLHNNVWILFFYLYLLRLTIFQLSFPFISFVGLLLFSLVTNYTPWYLIDWFKVKCICIIRSHNLLMFKACFTERTLTKILQMTGSLKCDFEGNYDVCFNQDTKDDFDWSITRVIFLWGFISCNEVVQVLRGGWFLCF